MKAKVFLGMAMGLVLFLLGGFIINNFAVAQQMIGWPIPQPCNRIIWDFDSGWTPLDAGLTKEIVHNCGGDPGEYLVYILLSEVNDGSSVHQAFTGHMQYPGVGIVGGHWHSCTSTSIKIARGSEDDHFPAPVIHWNYVRVRILKNQ